MMTNEEEPMRLVESLETPPGLRRLLVRAHQDVPPVGVQGQLAKAALSNASGAPGTLATSASAIHRATSVALHSLKVLSVTAVIGAGVGAGGVYLANLRSQPGATASAALEKGAPPVEARSARFTIEQLDVAARGSDEGEPALDGDGTSAKEAPMPASGDELRAHAFADQPKGQSLLRSRPSRKATREGRGAQTVATRIVHRATPQAGGAGSGQVPGVAMGGSQALERPSQSAALGADAQTTAQPSPEARGEPPVAELRPSAREPSVAEIVAAVKAELAKRPAPPAAEAARAAMPAPGETSLLRSARHALATAPNRTLSLTDEHLRRYPHGMLDQEREALAIEALVNLGRISEARARAQTFERAYPDSPHRARIQHVLARASGAATQP